MLGLAVHPDYPNKPYVYVYGTRDIAGAQYDQLLRITNHKGSGTALKVLLSRRAAPPEALNLHDGGRLEFGPDGLSTEARRLSDARKPDHGAGRHADDEGEPQAAQRRWGLCLLFRKAQGPKIHPPNREGR